MIGFPKPEKRATVKRRKSQLERVMKTLVRAACVERDGHCRVSQDTGVASGWCDGPSEWAHFGDFKRFKTRGQAPWSRHTTAGSLMLCTRHHADYDQGRLKIRATSKRLCNGPLTYRRFA